MMQKIIRVGTVMLALAVITGAFGAHALKSRLSPEFLSSWKTAVEYQFYHGLGLLLIGILSGQIMFDAKRLRIASQLMTFGIVLFSGSIYFLSTKEITGLNLKWLGPITPIGGLLFIAAWIMVFFATKKKTSISA